MRRWFAGRGLRAAQVASIALASIALTGLAVDGAPSRYVFATASVYDTLDPHLTTHQGGIAARLNLYDGLLRWVDNPAKLELWLAEKHTGEPDGSSHTFVLRKDAKFHDGTDIRASDVVYSVERLLVSRLGAYPLIADLIAPGSTKAVDDDTVSFNLTKPSPIFLSIVPEISIVNAALVKRNEINNDWGRAWLSKNEAGSGSFALTRYDPSIGFVAERFIDHWNGQWGSMPIASIEFRTVPDAAKRVQGLIDGTYHGIDGYLGREHLDRLRREAGLHLIEADTTRLLQAILNNAREPMKTPAFRKALTHAFDYEGFSAEVGPATRNPMPLPAGIAGAPPSVDAPVYDLAKARQYLASLPPPKEIGIAWSVGDEQLQRAAERLRAGLDQLGLAAKLVPRSAAVLAENLRDEKADYDIVFAWQPTHYPDPSNWMQTYDCDQIGQRNASRYCNREVDRLLKDARNALDPQARRRGYETATAIVMEEAAGLFVHTAKWTGIFSRRVTGIRFCPVGEGQDMRWASMH